MVTKINTFCSLAIKYYRKVYILFSLNSLPFISKKKLLIEFKWYLWNHLEIFLLVIHFVTWKTYIVSCDTKTFISNFLFQSFFLGGWFGGIGRKRVETSEKIMNLASSTPNSLLYQQHHSSPWNSVKKALWFISGILWATWENEPIKNVNYKHLAFI